MTMYGKMNLDIEIIEAMLKTIEKTKHNKKIWI